MFIPSYRPHDDVAAQQTFKDAIYQCWKYNLGFHAYFSGGAARGAEINRMPSFRHCQLRFNSLHFQLRSEKNITHGRNFNQMVEHWLPPSASRRSIICNLLLYPRLEKSTFSLPSNDHINSALSKMFAKTMRLEFPLSTKVNRDFISVLVDYLAPRSLAKTSTTDEMAALFHHSSDIHDKHYSATIFRRDIHGKMIPSPLVTALHIWHALGETVHQSTHRPEVSNRILIKAHYDAAARRAYHNPLAEVSELQFAAISHASSKDVQKHAYVLMGCGTGKSGIYILLLLGAYLHRCPIPRCLVISPHNSLLAQHTTQARQYFRGTNLRVNSLLPSQVSSDDIPTDFDLLFISIHAFHDMVKNRPQSITDWKLDNIFIDEYHNVLGELFRYSSSWESLRNLSLFNVRIMCLSATSDKFIRKGLSDFMSLGDYVVIGDVQKYPVPQVRINIISNVYHDCGESLIQSVVQHCRSLFEMKPNHFFKIHAITMSKKDAIALSDSLNNAGLPSLWLTSELNSQQKSHVMKSWEDGPEKVLVSTFVDGIDNASTEDVIIVGATHSIYSLVQAIGRIRPPRQNMERATIHIFHCDSYLRYNAIEVDDNVSRAIGAGIVAHQASRDMVTKYYNSKFTSIGYKKWMEQQSCLRKILYSFFHINSDSCGHCSNCMKNNTITISANKAQKTIHHEKSNIAIVLESLEVMANVCYVCRQYHCNGIQCRSSLYNICFCCHASTNRNVHKRETCAVARQPAVQTMSQSCSGCYMAMSSHIPNRGALHKHQDNQCPLKKRVKRVLLYGVEDKLDHGVSARRVLASTLSDHASWFATMSQNIKLIDDHRRQRK